MKNRIYRPIGRFFYWTFVRHEDGRAAAANGEHDDAVMAIAVALAAASY
jgi:hypothetical protein